MRGQRIRAEFAASGLTQTAFARLHGMRPDRVSRIVRGLSLGQGGPIQRKQRPEGPEYLIHPETGCWIWQRGLSGGYGAHAQGLAHRVYYERAKGPIPEGLQLDHLCRVHACVNPDHLEPATNAVNTQRGLCAKLTPERVVQTRERFAAGGVTVTALAAEMGMDTGQLSRVLRGTKWANVDGPRTAVGHTKQQALTMDQAREIRRRHAAGDGTLRSLGREFGVSSRCICHILPRKTYADPEAP